MNLLHHHHLDQDFQLRTGFGFRCCEVLETGEETVQPLDVTFQRGEQRRRDLCHLGPVLVVDCLKKLWYHFRPLQFVPLEITSECSVARSEADQDASLIQEKSLTQKSVMFLSNGTLPLYVPARSWR